MKNFKIYVLLSVIILMISGCSGLEPSNIAKIKKIGIISNIDNKLYIAEDSTVMDSIDISSWNINNYVTNVFSNNIRFINKPLKFDTSTSSLFSKYADFNMMDEKRIEILKPIMEENKLDAILYVGNKPKILEIHPMGGLSIAKLLFGTSIKKEALCIVDLFQKIDGKIVFNREYMFSITDANKKIWDENNNTIFKSYVNGLEGEFKRDIEKTIKKFIIKNNL
ncbi:hypothetical protein [Arcobacter sp.]|uniref:hypothetical protein n=1 Tax=Arcobacter sp. TaxID=1872629 RepID=UPI003D11CA33